MIRYISKTLQVLITTRKSLILLLTTFIAASLLEALGIGLIAPFLDVVSDPNLISEVYAYRWLSEKFHVQSNEQFVLLLGLLVISIFIIKSTLYFLSKFYIFRFSYNQKRLIASRLLQSYLAAPYTFHLKRNTASLIKNIVLETDHFIVFCLLPLLEAIANSLVVLVLLGLLLSTDTILLIMILSVLLPVLLIFIKFGKKFKKWGMMASQAQQERIRIVNHALGGLKETKTIGCEAYFEKQLDEQSQKFAFTQTYFQSAQILPRVLVETALILFLVSFFSLSQTIFQKSYEEVVSVLAIFAVATMRLVPSFSLLVQSLGKLQEGTYALDVIYHDLCCANNQVFSESQTSKPTLRSKNKGNRSCVTNNHTIFNFSKMVELKQVSYQYPSISRNAIDDVSLSIQKGQSIAFIGKSGAGKTTLVDIILGLLRPTEGDIQVDGISIYQNLRAWQNLVAYIPQSIFLLDDTVEHNIAFGVPGNLVNYEKLNQAIEAAQLTDLLGQLPEGIKTSIGERGVRLSGGQRQRIGIARALYHEREILILDEATSALDNETERLVSQAINSLAGNKTLIIIAHRLSTIESCDKVCVLEEGRISRLGSYQEVI